MTYIPYGNFNRGVLPFCNGLPEIVALDAIRNAAIEFCDQSHWLQYTPDATTGIANIATYQLDTPTDTIVARVMNAWWDSYIMVAKSDDQLQELFGIDWRTVQGTPRYYVQTDDATSLVVVPFPLITEANSLTSLVVLRPSRDSLTCDQVLYEYWYDAICSGALSKLMSTPGQAYTNLKVAAEHAIKFRDGVSRAKIERNRGMNRANVVMRPPRIF